MFRNAAALDQAIDYKRDLGYEPRQEKFRDDFMSVCVTAYIYIYRERERDRGRKRD